MAVDFLERVVHGGTGKQQQEKTKKKVLDFSASINPVPPRFNWHCDPEALEYYPDDQYVKLKNLIGRIFHRRPEEICVGNGSMEIIRVFCSVILRNNKTFFTQTPTFGEYEFSARLAGASRTDNYDNADVSFICNPNNPTGVLCLRTDLLSFLKESGSHKGIVFLDEAFIELSDPDQSLVDVPDPHLFVLRSLTKSFAVPGIRFGYGFGDPDLIEKMEIARPPWNVNAYAEAFAMQAFLHMGELATSRAFIEQERAWLVAQLNGLGFHCPPSSANYLLVEFSREVAPLCAALGRKGVLVRDCTSFGLPRCIRVAIRTREENRILVEALVACVR